MYEFSIFFLTHITSDLESIADYIVFLIDGNIVYSGTKDELIEGYVLIKGELEDLVSLDNTKLIGLIDILRESFNTYITKPQTLLL